MIFLLHEISSLQCVFYKLEHNIENSLNAFDVMKLQYGSTIVRIIFPCINKHDCSFTRKISSTFSSFPHFPQNKNQILSLYSKFLITLRVASTNNENILHKQSQLILCIKHNFHSLSRIQFFFSSCRVKIKLNVNERNLGLLLHFVY